MQVELAHGGRGQSSSSDRRGGHGSGGGGRFGVSRHSEYRGAYEIGRYCWNLVSEFLSTVCLSFIHFCLNIFIWF